MKNLFALIVLFFVFLPIICIDSPKNPNIFNNNTTSKEIELLRIKQDNVVMIKGEINGITTPKILSDLFSVKDNDIYIYLTTPGGSVIHGHQIIEAIDVLKMSGKNVYCVGDIANSMGFVILQACPTRYVRKSSILMQHQMSLSLEGPLEHIKTKLNMIRDIEDKFVELQSNRLDMTREEFEKKVVSDWWLYGENAIDNKVADKVVNIICDFDFSNKTYVQEITTIFGDIVLTYSACPLIRDPLKVDVNLHFNIDEDSVDQIIDKYSFAKI